MDIDASESGAQPTHGCMECKAPRSYTVEPFANGNTGWRCVACGQILCLLPGKYLVEEPSDEFP
jgi:hypothetical protein